MSSFEDVNWPRGNESPGVLALERDLRKELGRLGYGLIADRTVFADPHYRGGYAIVDKFGFVAGRDFDLTIADVNLWVESFSELERSRHGKRKRGKG